TCRLPRLPSMSSDALPSWSARAPRSRRAVSRYYAKDPTELRISVSAVVWRDEPRASGGARELLLIQRSDNAHWGLPGGYVERGEAVADAVAREVFEETGVRIAVGRLVGVYSDPGFMVIEYADGRRVHAVSLCFEATPVGQ